ncbi:uncharacterized protein RCC_11015 [Ramularia collo-cygni]|uniref:RING-type domain-containing protein n=1 Tax=Ramularia collo-cygni TaxID=112498 RepID=A0A2D3V4S9_9PEZI|nr:uncharacterized protein RCC_11015 [Ramularia collo-cygni]CZT25287.1 uncharacterized protein RCC_11015 [Ramularia collo-cygni]
MLTRAEFFAQAPAIVQPGDTCPICLEELEGQHPLRLRCNPNHVYCRECIRPWATQHRRCILMCGIEPWDPAPWTDISQALIHKTNVDLFHSAKYTFGVSPGTRADYIAGSFTFTEDDTFLPLDGRWIDYLAARREPNMKGIPMIQVSIESQMAMEGVGLSEPERLLLPIVNLANVIPLLAANSGRPYNASDMQQWRLVATHLVSHIPMDAVVFPEIEVVPRDLKEVILKSLSTAGADVTNITFLQKGTHGSDLDLLMEYVAYIMYRECWVTSTHTRPGFIALQKFRSLRKIQARRFEQATWMLEDPERQCEMM